jgi:CheY-like chemotaxis protein
MNLLEKESLRIVHVEDNDDFAILTDLFLKRAGFNQPITRLSCGTMAVDYLSRIEVERAPHVILLDLHMPHMNGLEVLHWLRHSYSERDVAVYLLTSSDDLEDMRQAAAVGVTEYLFKTPVFDELIQKLDQLIAVRNHKRLEEVIKMQESMAEFALMGEHTAEMVVLTDIEEAVLVVNN